MKQIDGNRREGRQVKKGVETQIEIVPAKKEARKEC